jgi:hypothetical protein
MTCAYFKVCYYSLPIHSAAIGLELVPHLLKQLDGPRCEALIMIIHLHIRKRVTAS